MEVEPVGRNGLTTAIKLFHHFVMSVLVISLYNL